MERKDTIINEQTERNELLEKIGVSMSQIPLLVGELISRGYTDVSFNIGHKNNGGDYSVGGFRPSKVEFYFGYAFGTRAWGEIDRESLEWYRASYESLFSLAEDLRKEIKVAETGFDKSKLDRGYIAYSPVTCWRHLAELIGRLTKEQQNTEVTVKNRNGEYFPVDVISLAKETDILDLDHPFLSTTE